MTSTHTLYLLTKGNEFIGKEVHGRVKHGCLELQTEDKFYRSTIVTSVRVRENSPSKVDVTTASGNVYVFQVRGRTPKEAAAWWADKVLNAVVNTAPKNWGEALAAAIIAKVNEA